MKDYKPDFPQCIIYSFNVDCTFNYCTWGRERKCGTKPRKRTMKTDPEIIQMVGLGNKYFKPDSINMSKNLKEKNGTNESTYKEYRQKNKNC